MSVNNNTNSYISPKSKISDNVHLSPFVFIADNVTIEENVRIEPGAIIYENVHIGAGSFIGAQCILGERLAAFLKDDSYANPVLQIGPNSVIRSGTIIYAGVTVGSSFQTGNKAVIREDSIFGDNCSFGTLSQSDGHIKVGNNCRFHNNVFIATYTTIEDDVHFYPMSCTVDSLHPPCQKSRQGPYLEKGVIVGAKALILPNVRIGAGSVIAGASVVTSDTPPQAVLVGAPAKVVKMRSEVRCHIEDRPAYEVALETLSD
jgi:acetyltransferase-like isoleucine patch superfamily enzyme